MAYSIKSPKVKEKKEVKYKEYNNKWITYGDESEYFTTKNHRHSIFISEKVGWLGTKAWYVTIGDAKTNIVKEEKPFENKEEAINYAKKYMREN
jgi:hypothetical protein